MNIRHQTAVSLFEQLGTEGRTVIKFVDDQIVRKTKKKCSRKVSNTSRLCRVVGVMCSSRPVVRNAVSRASPVK